LLVGANDLVCQCLLDGLPLNDLLFNRALGDKLVDGHRLRLTNAMGSILCLVVIRRIPVVIVEDHGVSTREI
jgi:hypothetical protein